MTLDILLLLVAISGVIKSADWFLKSVEVIGKRLKLPAFILGVLLVGFGTSLPELATSISSVINDTHNVTIANIIGSNMANVLLLIGISTFFLGTITYKKNLIDLDLPHLFCVSVLFAILIADGNLDFNDGLLLLVGFVMYLLYHLTQRLPKGNDGGLIQTVKVLFKKTSAKKPKTKKQSTDKRNFAYVIIVLIASVIILSVSSRLAVISMLNIAEAINIAVEAVTFVTIALGTSLPELLVTFKALKRGQGDLVLGNIIGSSVFNILLVGGVVALIHPQVIDAGVLTWSIVGLVIASMVAILNGITKKIHAWEGVVFILIYIALISKIIT